LEILPPAEKMPHVADIFQDKVCEELDHIFQGSDLPPTMKELNMMKYLERVIKESLRLYPSVPFIAREITEDVQIGN
jgi:cytochrome P450 family 4